MMSFQKIYSPMQLANAMKLVRQQNGWTQSELAKKIGIKQATISNFENNPNMLGARQRNKVNGQGYYNEIGVGLEIPDGFGGTKQDQIIIRVSQALVNAGVMNQANNFIGKLVQIPVYVRVWSMEGREGVTYNISSDGGITEIKG